MKIFEDLFLLQRVDYLIRTRATGTPAQLARRLETCERNIFRLIGQLRDIGLPILYDKKLETYYYAEPVKLEFSIAVGAEMLLQIRGGEGNLYFFDQLPISGSDNKELCTASTPVAFRARGGGGAGES
ncbi:MAG: hypothetical protein L6Q97_02235 [Thermoanaerobaculia bacterium]|nr:hypothetical protein [Thermoanaerobaculia bacterium]